VGGKDQLRVEVRHEQDRVVLRLQGELDLVSAPVLQRAIADARTDSAEMIVLDLQDLQFIDSAGLRTILSGHEDSREHGREFAVTPGSQQVQRLLAVAGVSEHLRIIASPDELLV
jgi:anti-sigma B factor antagonist